MKLETKLPSELPSFLAPVDNGFEPSINPAISLEQTQKALVEYEKKSKDDYYSVYDKLGGKASPQAFFKALYVFYEYTFHAYIFGDLTRSNDNKPWESSQMAFEQFQVWLKNESEFNFRDARRIFMAIDLIHPYT